ncbi:MAG: hypothetical protein IPJ07_04280 [Acidobacteria bacterium]|nr:hypothetical protein [Acidobacteriota bacterium]
MGNEGTWNRDGVILFSGSAAIYRVPATGGEPVPTLRAEQPGLYRFPIFLPDGRHFLVLTAQPGAMELHLAALDRQETTPLLAADSQASYANGHLLFARAGALLAAPFDADSLKLTGESFVVADKVRVSPTPAGSFRLRQRQPGLRSEHSHRHSATDLAGSHGQAARHGRASGRV